MVRNLKFSLVLGSKFQENLNRILKIAGVILSIIFLFVFWYFDPAQTRILPGCAFHSMTGLYCPTCGAQRSLHQLLHLDIINSLKYNILLFPGLLFLAYLALVPFAEKKLGIRLPKIVLTSKTILILLGIFIFYGIIRNIGFFPQP